MTDVASVCHIIRAENCMLQVSEHGLSYGLVAVKCDWFGKRC